MVNYDSIYNERDPNNNFYMTNRYNMQQLEKSKKKKERYLRIGCCSFFIAVNGLTFYLCHLLGSNIF